ncbi:MAG: polynucleotide kinase-phosphatase [Hyphomicrobiaceae bacterium]
MSTTTTDLSIPEFALVLLVGASGSGKSTFGRKHFLPTEVISSDYCRGLVSDDENSQEATGDAFDLLRTLVEIRLKRRRLTVVDATNVRAEDRKGLVALARRCHALPVAIVIDPGEAVCHARNALRPDRQFGPHVVRNQRSAMRRGLHGMKREGFGTVHVLDSEAAIDAAVITRQRLWTDKRDEKGPFDIIGDVHGCFDELAALLVKLGYAVEAYEEPAIGKRYRVTPPHGRKVLFVGDLVDRGPRVGDTLRLAMDMVESGTAHCVVGNHEAKVEKWLRSRDVQIKHGLDKTIADLEAGGDAFKRRVKTFIGRLVSHYMLDGGKLAVAHAGIKAEMQNRASSAIRAFCMYGETTGETDEFGLPVRHNWAADYRGETRVIYGHTPVVETEWLNNTLCIDTGCVFGGKLTALRYPEMELIAEPARAVYSEPVRPLVPASRSVSAQQEHDDTLDLADVSGKRILTTRYTHSITVREENAAAALEVMVRFAVDPRWLIYLPPTMSPSETTERDGYLEYPAEALAFYRQAGVSSVICEEKHMGSRAIVVIARDADVARRRFGIVNGETGMIYTRTGRQFFSSAMQTREAVTRTAAALEAVGLFRDLDTDWLCLDAEIMPWSAKAQSLIEQQYGPVGAAARTGLSLATIAAQAAEARGVDVGALTATFGARERRVERFSAAVRQYCWPINGLEGVKIAPFHILAAEGRVFTDEPHTWHMETLARLASHDPLLQETRTQVVDFSDPASEQAAIDWWLAMTEAGGEGMVIKPPSILVRGAASERGPGRIQQPAEKSRGRDYHRIIYGPDYDAPENLVRLRRRGLGAKRSLASREFALGLEALHRFVAHEPLRRVHECVFAVLALESEPIDPRL